MIALLRTGLDHLDGCRDGVDVGCNADNVQDAVLLVRQVTSHVGTSHICHHCQLHLRVENIPQHLPDSVLVAELPLAELGLLEQFRVCQITDFHNIHACTEVGQIQLADKIVCKLKVVHQTAVPDGGIQHFYVRTIGDHRAFYHITHCTFLAFCFSRAAFRQHSTYIIPKNAPFCKYFRLFSA